MKEESKIQQTCVKWFRMQYPHFKKLLFSVPNGAYLKGTEKQRAMRWGILQSEGAVAGTSDLILALNPIIFIEIKTPEGTQSPEQKEFERVMKLVGHEYHIIRSFDEFYALVKSKMSHHGKINDR